MRRAAEGRHRREVEAFNVTTDRHTIRASIGVVELGARAAMHTLDEEEAALTIALEADGVAVLIGAAEGAARGAGLLGEGAIRREGRERAGRRRGAALQVRPRTARAEASESREPERGEESHALWLTPDPPRSRPPARRAR